MANPTEIPPFQDMSPWQQDVWIRSTPEDLNAPPFDGGSFVITNLSTSPDGLTFETRNAIGRTEASPGPVRFSEEEQARLRSAMQGEMRFKGVEGLRAAKTALNEAVAAGAPNEEVARHQNELDATRAGYTERDKKIGIRNITQEGDTVIADVQVVPFPVYRAMAGPNDSPERAALSAALGVDMIVRTADSKMVIQHRAVEKQRLHEDKRTRGNAVYADIPGASVAGMVDATMRSEDRQKGMPDPISTETLTGAVLKEAGEELGLSPDDFERVRMVGIALDNIKTHNEAMFLADSRLTADEITEASRQSNRNKNLGEADFEEKFVMVECSPEAIHTLLTEVKCPLPPTHAAVLAATGYMLVLERDGQEAADYWRHYLEYGIQENYKEIDDRVRAFYSKHPEGFAQVPERFWGKHAPARNPYGYEPAYTPEEQGLPNFEDEMVRTGLTPEHRNVVEEAYLLDVDGPVSDPIEKRVTETDLADELVTKLEEGKPVGLNSGRSTNWVMDRVVPLITERISDTRLLANFVVIGEMANTWVTFDEVGGQAHHGRSSAIGEVPAELKEQVDRLIDDKYADVVGVLDPKETMLSLEMQPGFDLATFTALQEKMQEELSGILEALGLQNTYNVDGTTIAIDIASPHSGKDLGSDRFLQFLRDRGIVAKRFITFGDSKSDKAMAEELARRGKEVEFVFVGEPSRLGEVQGDFPVHVVGGYSRGTLDYLRSGN